MTRDWIGRLINPLILFALCMFICTICGKLMLGGYFAIEGPYVGILIGTVAAMTEVWTS